MLSADTQAILLLCANFGQNRSTDPSPLTLSEYNSLAGWLRQQELTPADLLDRALVVSATANQGGTWHGAIEALEKIKNIPVFVRLQGNIPDGNQQLINRGAKAFPVFPFKNSLSKLLTETKVILNKNDAVIATANDKTNIYEAVLPIILQHLKTPQNLDYLVTNLCVRRTQLQD